MNNCTITGKEALTLLKLQTRFVSNTKVSYTMYKLESGNAFEYYLLEVATESEGELCVLFGEYESSRELFMRIADGLVTPASLLDVISDFNMLKKY